MRFIGGLSRLTWRLLGASGRPWGAQRVWFVLLLGQAGSWRMPLVHVKAQNMIFGFIESFVVLN